MDRSNYFENLTRESYKEMDDKQINEELTFLPDTISEKEYDWEISKIEQDAKEAELITDMPPEIKNAEQRKAHINGDIEYLKFATDNARKKTDYHKLLNRKDCVMEIARNIRASLKAHFTDVRENENE